MKNLFSIAAIALILLCKISLGQIALEHTYDHAASGGLPTADNTNQLYIVNFEDYGMHYVKVDRVSNQIDIYDLNHLLTKTLIPPFFDEFGQW